MSILAAIPGRLDSWIERATANFDRLIGVALLRLALGVAAIIFYVANYDNRAFLWGPNGYDSMATASQQLKPGAISLYLVSDSKTWFELLFHGGLIVAVAFTVIGGRVLTVLHAVLLWSLYNRNHDIPDGGDNLAQIMIIFMMFTVNNAYLALGARRRRIGLTTRSRPIRVLIHNAAVVAMLVQIAMLYFVAGYYKATAEIWTNGTAMYYISRLHQFSMVSWYPHVMNNVYLGWVIGYFTIIAELAVPFVIWSKRAAIRKLLMVSLEGMHAGIIVFMGLVTFGLIMIGADSMILNDRDYQNLQARAQSTITLLRRRYSRRTHSFPQENSLIERPHSTRERVGI